jgi:hypothetical protein
MGAKHFAEQLNGVRNVKSKVIRPLYAKAEALMGAFDDLVLEWIPREENGKAHRGACKRTADIWTPGE